MVPSVPGGTVTLSSTLITSLSASKTIPVFASLLPPAGMPVVWKRIARTRVPTGVADQS